MSTKQQSTKNNKVVLSGDRNLQDGLWDIKLPVIHLPKPSKQLLNAIIRKGSSKKYIADYIYKNCFSPPMSTFSKALQRGHFITWPGIDDKSIKKYFQETMSAAK